MALKNRPDATPPAKPPTTAGNIAAMLTNIVVHMRDLSSNSADADSAVIASPLAIHDNNAPPSSTATGPARRPILAASAMAAARVV